MGIYVEDFEDNYQQVYSNVVRRVNSLEEKENLTEEEGSTLKVYRSVEEYFARRVNQKEFLVIDKRYEEYVVNLVREFVIEYSKLFPPRHLLFILTQELEGIKSLINYRLKYGEDYTTKELSDVVSGIYEIEHMKTVYFATETVLAKELKRFLLKDLDKVSIDRDTVEMDGTINVYKTVVYGSVYYSKNDLEEYEVKWLNSLGYTGDVNTEPKVNFAKVSSRLSRLLEGKFRQPSNKEKEVGERFLWELKKEVQEEGLDLKVEIQPLDSEASKVIYIGDLYEVIIRKRFTVHWDSGTDPKHYLTLTSAPVHKTTVKHIKKVAKGIITKVKTKGNK